MKYEERISTMIHRVLITPNLLLVIVTKQSKEFRNESKEIDKKVIFTVVTEY